jgi:hypothetical protein
MESKIMDSVSFVTFIHHYHNNFETPIETSFIFPLIPSALLSTLEI